MTMGKIMFSKLLFYESINAQIAILDTAIFETEWVKLNGTKSDEQDET